MTSVIYFFSVLVGHVTQFNKDLLSRKIQLKPELCFGYAWHAAIPAVRCRGNKVEEELTKGAPLAVTPGDSAGSAAFGLEDSRDWH